MPKNNYELHKKFYELTGLKDTESCWRPAKNADRTIVYLKQYRMGNYASVLGDVYPYYDSDYLLGVLLPVVSVKFAILSDGNVGLFYNSPRPDYADYKADNPLEALLKLGIVLAEKGLLDASNE